MKKRIMISAVCILALLLIAFGIWYTRPMTFTELLPELDRSKTGGLSAMYRVQDASPDGRVDTYFDVVNLDGEDPAIRSLFQILDSHTYRRSLTSLLPRLNAVASIKDPYAWDVAVGGGYSLHLSVTTGRIDMHYTDDTNDIFLYCIAKDQDTFERSVYELLAAKAQRG